MVLTNKLAALSLVMVGVGLLGCSEDVGSGDIRTGGMYAKFAATADGDGTTLVTARLTVGGPNGTVVNQLDGEDELVARVEGADAEAPLLKDGNRFRRTFETDEDGSEFVIAFNRPVDEDAPDSRVVLPDGFTPQLVSPTSVARGNDVIVEWSPAGDGTMDWEIEGDCIGSEDATTPDDGELTIRNIDVSSLDEGESCTVTVILTRTNQGTVDSAFEEGGEFIASQRRAVQFESTPGPDEEGSSETGMGGAPD